MAASRTKSAPKTESEPEVFLKRYRDISDRRRDSEEAKSAWKAEIETAASRGVNVRALKLVEKLRKMKPNEAQQMVRDTVLYLRWLGLNILDQMEMFDTSTDGLTEQVIATHAAWEAGQQGYTAGKAGEPLDSNPYAPGTETHQRWASEWYDGADDRGAEAPPGTTDIQPREDNGENPEDGADEAP